MTRREMMERMGSDELAEQLAFDRIEPLEDGYWQAALICRTLAQVLGGKGAKNAKIEHFLPGRPTRADRPMTAARPADVFAALDRYAAAKGGLKRG